MDPQEVSEHITVTCLAAANRLIGGLMSHLQSKMHSEDIPGRTMASLFDSPTAAILDVDPRSSSAQRETQGPSYVSFLRTIL